MYVYICFIIDIIIIIIKSTVVGCARLGESATLYQSEDPNPTQPTNGNKKI